MWSYCSRAEKEKEKEKEGKRGLRYANCHKVNLLLKFFFVQFTVVAPVVNYIIFFIDCCVTVGILALGTSYVRYYLFIDGSYVRYLSLIFVDFLCFFYILNLGIYIYIYINFAFCLEGRRGKGRLGS